MEDLMKMSDEAGEMPDLQNIIDTLPKICDLMETDEMILLRNTNKGTFEQKMEEHFPEFSDKNFSLFRMIIHGNIDTWTNLIEMIKTLCMVKLGQISMGTANQHISNVLAEQYIYPKFGGKANFEKKVKEENDKKPK